LVCDDRIIVLIERRYLIPRWMLTSNMPYGVADKKKWSTHYIDSVRKKNFVAEFIYRLAEIDISILIYILICIK
jgi:hypothetical protein